MQWQRRIGSRQRQKALQKGEGGGGTSSGELVASGGWVAKRMWWVWKPVPHQCQKRESLLVAGLSMWAPPIAPWWSREGLWPSPSPSLMLNPNLNPSSRLY